MLQVPTPLTPDRWRTLQALFAEGSDLPAAEHETFVARVAGDDKGLARDLRGMLAQVANPAGRIQRAIAHAAATAPLAEVWVGRRIGAYKIVREIGRGGMGVVFEAVREEEYHKRVALKIAPSAALMTPLDTRFRLERQILAELEHPHIARFLDGGTDNGVPYFVMEYVDGVPITDYCRGRDLRDRIALVQQLCDALQYAHERLVVHRDLKPTNILVTADGTPKVLDFGIAKILDPQADPGATLGAATWTPDYVSPEQIGGRIVSTRTDVYSLGLVLYEVLTGERAQPADTSSPMALQQSVCEREPVRASERVAASNPSLARRLRGDLDTIVLAAIQKDPERRYASMAALGDDLHRYLDGHPILARRSTWAYRTGKLLRRHRTAAVAAALVVISVAAGLVGTIYQARRADRRFQQVRALANAFVFDVHDRIEMLPGATEARRSIVQTALTYLENLRRDAGGDPSLAKELAAAYEKVGTVQGYPLSSNLGDTDGALTSYRQAEEILTPFASQGDREARLRVAGLARRIANVQTARGDVAAAMLASARARETGEALLADTPSDRQVMSMLGEVYADIGRAAMDRRDYAAAETAGQRAMELTLQLLGADPDNRAYRNNLSTAHNVLGASRIGAGRLEQAAENFRQAIDIRAGLVRDEPANLEFKRTLMVSYGNLGDVLGYRVGENLGDAEGAADAFGKATAIADEAMLADAADRRAVFDAVNAKLRLGALLVDNPRRISQGLVHLEDADRLNQRLLAEEPGSARYGYLALVLNRRLGDALLSMGRTADGIARLQRVRTEAPRLLAGPTGANARLQLVFATVRLAEVRARAGDPRAAGLADAASREIGGTPIQPPTLAAQINADLDRIRIEIAKPRR